MTTFPFLLVCWAAFVVGVVGVARGVVVAENTKEEDTAVDDVSTGSCRLLPVDRLRRRMPPGMPPRISFTLGLIISFSVLVF